MLRRRHAASTPGGAIGLAGQPGGFQFAFAQMLVMRGAHHHKAAFAANRDGRFRLALQRGFDRGNAAHFEVVGIDGIH